MVINKFSKTGSYHRALNQENQDYLYSIEGKEFVAIMLADGATACEMGLEGAKLSCQAMTQVIEREGTVFFNYPKEKIAYLLTEQILYCIECNKRETCDLKEYGSTFALVFLEKKTGRTVLVNLGDGAIMSVDEENKYSYLMRPKRYRGNPCLTTTKGATKAIEIDVVNISLGNTLFLCTDGFLEMLRDNDVADQFSNYDCEGLNQVLLSKDNSDDCSYISFTRRRK